MPSRSELPGDLSRRKFLNALRRLGFEINTVGGKGDHFKVVWPATQKSVTVIGDVRKDVLYYLLKEIEAMSGVVNLCEQSGGSISGVACICPSEPAVAEAPAYVYDEGTGLCTDPFGIPGGERGETARKLQEYQILKNQ